MEGLYIEVQEVEGENVKYSIVIERERGGRSTVGGMTQIGEAIDMTEILDEAIEEGYQRGLSDGREQGNE